MTQAVETDFWKNVPASGTAQAKLEGAARDVLASERTRKAFSEYGVDTGSLVGAEFKAFVDAEMTKWAGVARDAEIPAQ